MTKIVLIFTKLILHNQSHATANLFRQRAILSSVTRPFALKLQNLDSDWNWKFVKPFGEQHKNYPELSKGQLISKRHFVIFNSPKKQTKKIQLYFYEISSRIVFVLFLWVLKTPKIHFEIYWPLGKNWAYFDSFWILILVRNGKIPCMLDYTLQCIFILHEPCSNWDILREISYRFKRISNGRGRLCNRIFILCIF